MKQAEKDPKKMLDQDEKIVKLVRIVVRAIGPILFLIMLPSAISQGGLDRLINLSGEETITFVGILTMFFGIIWAYQNEIAGGIVIVIVYIVMAMLLGSLFPNAIYPIFLIVGILNIYLGVMELSLRKRQ